jgi:hypothetical protein
VGQLPSQRQSAPAGSPLGGVEPPLHQTDLTTDASFSLTSQNETVETSETNETLFFKRPTVSDLACEDKGEILPNSQKCYFPPHFPKMRHAPPQRFDRTLARSCSSKRLSLCSLIGGGGIFEGMPIRQISALW